jgi:hypothetical protein
MEKVLRYRSLEAFCRQRAQICTNDSFGWLEKASLLASLAAAESRVGLASVDDDQVTTDRAKSR